MVVHASCRRKHVSERYTQRQQQRIRGEAAMIATIAAILLLLCVLAIFVGLGFLATTWVLDRTLNTWIWRRYGRQNGWSEEEIKVLERSSRGIHGDPTALAEALDMREKREGYDG